MPVVAYQTVPVSSLEFGGCSEPAVRIMGEPVDPTDPLSRDLRLVGTARRLGAFGLPPRALYFVTWDATTPGSRYYATDWRKLFAKSPSMASGVPR